MVVEGGRAVIKILVVRPQQAITTLFVAACAKQFCCSPWFCCAVYNVVWKGVGQEGDALSVAVVVLASWLVAMPGSVDCHRLL